MNLELSTLDYQNIIRIFAEYRPATFQDAEVAVGLKQKIGVILQQQSQRQLQSVIDKAVAEATAVSE